MLSLAQACSYALVAGTLGMCTTCEDSMLLQIDVRRLGAGAEASTPPCVDTSGASLNRMGNGCEVYRHDPAAPFEGICLDPYYDDEDFTSALMCCVCPEECPPMTEISGHGANCEDWVGFSRGGNGSKAPHSNLGGLGPQSGKPKELRYYGVGSLADETSFDLAFTNISEYIPRNTNHNKVVNGQAQVNVKIGESVLLFGEFVRANTFCPVTPHLPKITFCDIDDDHSGPKEVVKVDGVKAFYTVDDVPDFDFGLHALGTLTSGSPSPAQNITSVIQTQVAGRMARKYTSLDGGKFGVQVTSKEIGTLQDNPTDFNNLVVVPQYTYQGKQIGPVDQAKRCFMIEFDDTSNFTVELKIDWTGAPLNWGRNFLMSGTSVYFAGENASTCPTPAPSPSPTPMPTPAPPTSMPTPTRPISDITPSPTLPIPLPPTPAFVFSSPTPAPVLAKGDPHLVNVYGQHFDLLRPGRHTMIQIPRWAPAPVDTTLLRVDTTLLRVDALVERHGGACKDVYIQTLNVSGKWVGEHEAGGHLVEGVLYSAKEPTETNSTGWLQFGGRVSLKVVWGHTRDSVQYLNLLVKNLNQAGTSVGGLLGEDDHTLASAPSADCQRAFDGRRLSLMGVEDR